MDPTNIIYYNNLSATYLEKKDISHSLEFCNKAIEVGKCNQASYKDIAKAYTRIGNIYSNENKFDLAIEAYEKSLIEDFNDKTKVALKKVIETKKLVEQKAYIDVGKSEEAKLRGNSLFQEGKYADAIAEYNDSLKRNPDNYKVYSNRAACYSKLMDWSRALEDCDACIKADSKFVKAYIRKGKVQHFLKQYHKALETYNIAMELEPSSSELQEARRNTMIAIQSSDADPERAKEAMKDPELRQILQDPTINKVLQDMQSDPKSGQRSLQDPDIRKKIEKLIAAGVLQVK